MLVSKVVFPCSCPEFTFPPEWNLSNTLTWLTGISAQAFGIRPWSLSNFRIQMNTVYITNASRCSQQLKQKAVFLRSYFMNPANLLFFRSIGGLGDTCSKLLKSFIITFDLGLHISKILSPQPQKEAHWALINGQLSDLWYHVHHCPYIHRATSWVKLDKASNAATATDPSVSVPPGWHGIRVIGLTPDFLP